jgi:hypothetical protein
VARLLDANRQPLEVGRRGYEHFAVQPPASLRSAPPLTGGQAPASRALGTPVKRGGT